MNNQAVINALCEHFDMRPSEAREHIERIATEQQSGPGIRLIAVERIRQIESEGWSPEHDDSEHNDFELTEAALSYGEHAVDAHRNQAFIQPPRWPWTQMWWKPSDDPIRNLEKAGALIAAEIDRLLRLQQSEA